ncbi:hypothetical protein EDD36DRAFT_467418 [Exophiala viscosa]|uniref:SigF-like NTF2-like domain-containing protein n=1 Tax=Exophiala viscosa TaxID=2486360 RepID=A0AAN6DPR9_9EURO|nr:hypothetical protein EDD36DRAFT_467418 [Exophiala viscosa]
MDDPVGEISHIIRTLCTAPPAIQAAAIRTHFTPNASFTHPFCRTGSFSGSIWLVIIIYRWYKILSPHIDVWIDSVAFDKEKMLLYVSIHQNFRLWIVPFYVAPVKFVTVLKLTTDPAPESQDLTAAPSGPSQFTDSKEDGEQSNGKTRVRFEDTNTRKRRKDDSSESTMAITDGAGGNVKYFIQSQDDLYQTSEWIKFLVPWGVGVFLMVFWQFWATFLCVVGTKIFDFLVWFPRKIYYTDFEVFDNNDKPELGAD